MQSFDGLALIGAISDQAETLLQDGSIDEVLDRIVQTIASAMGADVCSIYLYDIEADELVLRATVGLNRRLVGTLRLHADEGLTGYAFRNNSPVLDRNAAHARLNKPIPDSGEEEFPGFLGVPIRRGSVGVGVLTIQHRDPVNLNEGATRALRTVASHLATTLEHAAALYEVHETHAPPADEASFAVGLLHGTSASRGIAVGVADYLERGIIPQGGTVVHSIDQAIEASARQLQELQASIDESLPDVAALIFSSHLLMLRDDAFTAPMKRLAEADGVDPATAVQQVVDDFSRRFAAIPDPRFQEKVEDVRDLGHRIQRNLYGAEEQESDYRGAVVIAGEVFPSELVKLYLQRVEGIVFAGGGATGHIAILAQSLGLPVVATGDPRLFRIPTGTRVVVDAEDGKLVVAPARDILDAYYARIARDRVRHAGEAHTIDAATCTHCGTAITLLANVNLMKEAREAAEIGAAGVGLYRSEFPFLIRNGFPTEEEQFGVYRNVVLAMRGRPVAFRTLDLGGDKLLRAQVGREENPFLGFRGIRFLLEHRELFRDQLRAMLRAGADGPIGIQFPMVSTVEEVEAAKGEIATCIDQLRHDGVPHNASPLVGAMIEVPAAVEIADSLAEACDFLSIGTNDLVMYTVAADRTNHRVASLYRRIHPGVLRAVNRVVTAAGTRGIPVSVCGADAADPAMLMFYLGAGLRRLSLDATRLVTVAGVIARIDIDEAEQIAAEMLACSRVDALAAIARDVRRRFDPNDAA